MNVFDRRTRDMDIRALLSADLAGLGGALPGLGSIFSVPEWEPVIVRIAEEDGGNVLPDAGDGEAPVAVTPVRVFTLMGSDAQLYAMVELEADGAATEPYFAFLGAVPTSDITLTVADIATAEVAGLP